MNPALVFILLALAMLAAVLLVLCVALWRGAQRGANVAAHQREAANNPAQANAAVYRDQLEELTREHALGNLNDDELQAARDELTQRLLADVSPAPALQAAASNEADTAETATVWRKPWWGMASLVVLMPALALLMYSWLGQPAALDPMALKHGVNASEEVTPQKLADLVNALERRLQDEPNSMEGWVMLGRVQRARGRFDAAAQAYAKALALSRDDDLSIERAEVLAQHNGGNFAGEPWAIIRRVLAADAKHLNALFLAGSASYAQEDFRAALAYWERARRVVPADSPDAPELDNAIAQARSKLGLPAVALGAKAAESANRNTPAAKPASAAAQSISGRVSLGAELKNKVSATDTVFIYATPVSGSRMPVAIVRTTVAQLPFDFVLDDRASMSANAKLSALSEVTLRVRISKSGQAAAQAGDFGVSASPVKLGRTGVALVVREPLQSKP